ncbi:MAG: hypothetical protein DRI57_30270 [Deltaproteobacteria bacterium]|nr:MAG: hypothetical protein DRI57_30270 [Deltaproteobacteria bacterium]
MFPIMADAPLAVSAMGDVTGPRHRTDAGKSGSSSDPLSYWNHKIRWNQKRQIGKQKFADLY